MKGQTLSRYVKVKGQIIITGKKKKAALGSFIARN
jgi:hypothetical protein